MNRFHKAIKAWTEYSPEEKKEYTYKDEKNFLFILTPEIKSTLNDDQL